MTHAANYGHGRPVSWITQDRSGRKHQLQAAKALNETMECDTPGCDHHRVGLSSLCWKHANRLRAFQVFTEAYPALLR